MMPPNETLPDEILPDETVPHETVPHETVPHETVPDQTVPDQTVPNEMLPGNGMPWKSVSSEESPATQGPPMPEGAQPEPHDSVNGDDAEAVRVRLAVAGVEVSFRGRRSFFEQHVEPLLEAAYARAEGGQPEPGPAPVQGAMFQPASPQRFQKFAAQVGANAVTVDQRVMVFAFYLWNYERRDEFGLEDIASFFRTVKEEPPEDLAELLEALATAKRFLELRRGTEAMCLTTKGVNYVKNRLLGSV